MLNAVVLYVSLCGVMFFIVYMCVVNNFDFIILSWFFMVYIILRIVIGRMDLYQKYVVGWGSVVTQNLRRFNPLTKTMPELISLDQLQKSL